MKRENVKLLI